MSLEPCQKCKYWEKLSNTGWKQTKCNRYGIWEPEENNQEKCLGFEYRKENYGNK